MMRALSRIFLILVFLPLSTQLWSQVDWQEGHVVTLSGDTLRGMVRDRDTGPFGGLYKKVILKRPGKRKTRFRPEKLQSYRWGDVDFVVLPVTAGTEFLSSRLWIDPNGRPKVFRVVVDGPLCLYLDEFTDQDVNTIESVPYFRKAGEEELVRATQGIFGLKKKLLSKFFADRPELVRKIQSEEVKTTWEVVESYRQGADRP